MSIGIIPEEMERRLNSKTNLHSRGLRDVRNMMIAAALMAGVIGMVAALFVLGILSQLWSLVAVIIPAGIFFAFVMPRANQQALKNRSPRPSIRI